MSFIVYDFRCLDCGREVERMVRHSEVDSQICGCRGPGQRTLGPMKRLMPGPITTFKQGDRSAIKSRKKVSLRDPQHGARATGSEGLD